MTPFTSQTRQQLSAMKINSSSSVNDAVTLSDPTISFLINMGIGVAIFLFSLVFYDLLRYFFPGHCYCRQVAAQNPANNNYDGSPLKSLDNPSPYPLFWIFPTLRYPLETVVSTHGLDAAMYLRFLQTQAKIFFSLTIYTAVVLIPTYATANIDSSSGSRIQPLGLERASLVNVADSSPRLWATLVSEVAVLAIILIFLYYDMRYFTECRIKYRDDGTKVPSNFAILIMDIPRKYRDHSYLFNVFNSIFPGQVVAVHPVRDAHHLLTMKTRYIAAVNKRQRAQLSLASNSPKQLTEPNTPISTDQPTPQPKKSAITFDPNPPTFFSSPVANLDIHSRDLFSARFDLGNTVTIPVSSFPSRPNFYSPFDGGVIRSPSAPLSEILNEPGFVNIPSIPDDDVSSQSPGNSERLSESSHAPSPRLSSLIRTDSENIAHYNLQVKQARDLLEEFEKNFEMSAPFTHSAFIVFRSKVAATCAVTAPIFSCSGQFKVSRAPNPRSINWDRINISRYTTRIREYISFSILTTLTLLWTIPSSFIQALGNLTALGDALEDRGAGFLKQFVENNERFANFLEGVLPSLLLFSVLLLIPLLMRFVISFERIPSRVHAENKVRNFLFFFYVMSNFVYQVGFGSLLLSLEDIVTDPRNFDPREYLSILSSSVPGQATFLMKYVLTNSFLGSVIGMLNFGRLLFRPLLVWRAKTERDKIGADRLFADYPFAKMYALCMMISLISYVYATIAPIINMVAFMYFALAYLCSKQLLLFSHRPIIEGGGYLFRDAWTGLLVGLYVHQLSMIGIFLLKDAIIQAILTTVSMAFSIWFTVFCHNQFSSRVTNGSLFQQTPKEHEENMFQLDDEIPKSFINMYVHPGLKPVEVLESTNLDPATASLGNRSKRRHSRSPARNVRIV